jgi:signal transduction histidine kinase/ActR/RegA family two-component response regulator
MGFGKPRSLQTRTFIYNVTIVGAVVTCLTGLFLWEQHNAIERQLQLRADALAEFLASQIQFALLVGDRPELERIAANALHTEDVLSVEFRNSDDGILVRIARPYSRNPMAATGVDRLEVVRQVLAPESAVSDLDAAIPRRGALGFVRIGLSMQKQAALFAQTMRYAVAVAVLAFVLILFVQYVQFRRLLSPLKDLIQFTHRVGKGDLAQTAPVQRLDEIGQLAAAFNDMVGKLNVSREEMTRLVKQAQEGSRLKSEFLANISHEIRTPMNGIMGMAEVLTGTRLDPDQQECLRLMQVSSDSLLGIINDILDFSKIEAGKLDLDRVDFNLRELLRDIIESMRVMAEKKGLRLDFRVADSLPFHFLGDPIRLRQILVNLIGNAIKFTGAGAVTVSLDPGESANPAELHFAVRDTGIGIPEDQQKHIFEAFRQADGSTSRKYGGTGLGLAICSRLTALMGGRIWVESRPEAGSAFHFTAILALPENVPSRSSETKAAQTPLGKLRVLLAEDNPVNQKVALRLLERGGHEVVCANDGRQALDAFRREPFDLVLMDVQMPNMDGIEATAEIRGLEGSARKHTPILALTANAMKGDRERCLDAGMDGYVAKPLRAEKLFEAIGSVCSAERAGPAPAT